MRPRCTPAGPPSLPPSTPNIHHHLPNIQHPAHTHDSAASTYPGTVIYYINLFMSLLPSNHHSTTSQPQPSAMHPPPPINQQLSHTTHHLTATIQVPSTMHPSTVCCDPHSQGFSIVSEAEADAFLKFSCFFYDPTDAGNLISRSSTFSKSSLNIWKFSVHVLFKSRLENFYHYFVSM